MRLERGVDFGGGDVDLNVIAVDGLVAHPIKIAKFRGKHALNFRDSLLDVPGESEGGSV